MSIKKCFSDISNGPLKQVFEDKLASGMAEETAAAETLKEYNDTLQKRIISFKEGLGLETTTVAPLNTVEEFLAQPEPEVQKPGEDVVADENVPATEIDESDVDFTHRLPNGDFAISYKDALIQTEEGDNIEIGMFTGGEFFPIVTTKKNTNKNTEEGYINSMIASGYLAVDKVNSKGNYVFEAAGVSDLYKAMTSEYINNEVRAYLGVDGVVKDGNTFVFKKSTGNIKITDEQGNTAEVAEDEVNTMSFSQLRATYGKDNAINLIASREWANSRQTYRENAPVIKNADPAIEEEELQLRLLNLLSKMGVKTMSISNYVRNYKTKNGVNPSAKALADIANQIVAYTEGRVDELAEETAHFINEALPQDQVENVLRNIHKTEEWAEFSEVYREIYRDEYPADQLDAAVRREVLGKVVAKVVGKKTADLEGTETQRNLFQIVSDAINDFFSRVNSAFQPQHKQELDTYLSEVEKLLTQEDISSMVNTDNFKHNTFRFYSLDNADPNSSNEKLRRRALALTSQLRDAEKQYQKTGTGRRVNLRDLDRIQKDLETSAQVTSVTSLISMLNSNVRSLEAAINDSKKNDKSYFLTDEENILYQFVKGVGEKAVGELKQLVLQEDEINPGTWGPVIKELTASSQKMGELRAKIDLFDSQSVKKLVNDMMDKHNIPEGDRELVTKWIDRAQADTNLFHSTFGQLVHAKDGLLNLGGNIIRRMHNEAQVEMFNSTKKYLDLLKDLGVSTQEISDKFVDGQYIISETNFNEFSKDVDNIYVETYKEAALESITRLNPKIQALENQQRDEAQDIQLANLKEKVAAYESYRTLDNAEMIKLKNNYDLQELGLEGETKRKNLERPRIAAITERVMKDEYYDKFQIIMDAADVSIGTRQELSNLMSDLGDLRKKAYRKEDGKTVLDYNRLSEADLINLSALQKKRKVMKSYTDELGEIKRGLAYVREGGQTVLDPKTKQPKVDIDPDYKGDISNEARLALDINRLDDYLRDERDGQETPEKSADLFYSTISKIDTEEGRDSALRFLELNSYMSFTSDFWDNLGGTKSLVDRLRELKAQQPELTLDIDDSINNISETSFEMKNSLKMYNKKGNPAETDVDAMTLAVQKNIRDQKHELKGYMATARTLLREHGAEVEEDQDFESIGASDINEAYRAELERNNLNTDVTTTPTTDREKAIAESEIMEEHMTDMDKKAMNDLKLSIARSIGGAATTSREVTRLLKSIGKVESDLTDDSVQAAVVRIATRQRIAPYFKRFTSAAYSEFYENLKTTGDLAGALQGELAEEALIEINPNTSFYDAQTSEDMNPDFNNNFEGGYLQPKKMDKYKNKAFEKQFGTITTNPDGTKTSSKNANLYKAYEATLEYNRQTLEAMNVGENHNKFLLPQIRQTKTQRFQTFLKGNVGANVRNFTTDVLNYTEDEMIQGDEMYGNDVKIIPKMYIRSLENPEDVSTDLFHSLTLRAKEGFLRQSKVKYYGDLMSIHDKILTREMNGKTPEASNTYKMFKSALDYNLFGIKETTTYPVNTPFGVVDLTKLARTLLNFIKFRNLGLNVVIPITSLLTGAVTRRMEAWVGEFLDVRSQTLGGREYRKIAADGMKEIGVINTRSKLNILGQFYKAFDMNESFRNSKYGYLLRNMPRSGMALHAAANYPLYGKTLLGILHDYRVVDGTVMNKNTFKRLKAVDNLSKESFEKQWKDHEGKVLYNYIKHEGNKVEYDREAMGKDLLKDGIPLTAEQLEAQITELHNDVQGNVQYVNSIIDGQIPEDDRVYAQRHYLLSYFMTHRGWLSIATARKFKNRHLNLDTGVVEEGSYRSAFNYLGDYAQEWKDGNFFKFVGNAKEAWNKSDEVQRKNIKRVGVELGTLSTLMILSLALRSAAEDDDNEDLFALQLSNYLGYRTLNELSSVQFNIATNFSDTIESPFVGWSTIKNLFSVMDVFNGEEVKYGSYKGMTKSQKWLTKMVPGMKQSFDLQNMNQTYDTYKFYNQSNFSLTPINLMSINQLLEEKKE